MKLKKGAITILCHRECVIIEVHDQNAHVEFVSIKMTPENFISALGRHGYSPCEISVNALDKVGKTHESKYFEFEIPWNKWDAKSEKVKKIAMEMCPRGWEPDLFFSSQDSFFSKDKKNYARTVIRRWI